MLKELTNVFITEVGVPNLNGHNYPLHTVESEIARLKQQMSEKRVYGTSADSYVNNGYKTGLSDVSHVITTLKVKKTHRWWCLRFWRCKCARGKLLANISILDTTCGRDLAVLLHTGKVKWATMGYGSVVDGVIQNDYRLLTIAYWIDGKDARTDEPI